MAINITARISYDELFDGMEIDGINTEFSILKYAYMLEDEIKKEWPDAEIDIAVTVTNPESRIDIDVRIAYPGSRSCFDETLTKISGQVYNSGAWYVEA